MGKGGVAPRAAVLAGILAAAGLGALVGCVGGGIVGCIAGGLLGVIPAIFTLGFSILIGGGIGLLFGAAIGGFIGALVGGVTGYGVIMHRDWILATGTDALTKLLALVVYFKRLSFYYMDVNMWKLRGEGFYKARYETQGKGSRCPVIHAFDGNALCRVDDVVDRLKVMDTSLLSGDTVRHNWLGPTKLASGVMTDGVFCLGLKPADHEVVRPWLDKTLWGPAKTWDETKVRKAAREFLASCKTVSLPGAAKEFAVQCMAREWLGVPAAQLDAADFVKRYQTFRLYASLMPDWALKLPFLSWGAAWVRDQNAKYVDAICEALERTQPEVTDAAVRRLLAATALDALTYAGGLSVGDITQRAVAEMWNKQGAMHGFQLTEENVDQLIFETARLHPAVSNIAYERLTPFGNLDVVGREVLAIGSAMRDPKAWGADAEEFKLRGQAAYESDTYLAFGGGFNKKRNCPGQDLAICTIRSLLLEMDAYDWKVKAPFYHAGLSSKVWFFGYGSEEVEVELNKK